MISDIRQIPTSITQLMVDNRSTEDLIVETETHEQISAVGLKHEVYYSSPFTMFGT